MVFLIDIFLVLGYSLGENLFYPLQQVRALGVKINKQSVGFKVQCWGIYVIENGPNNNIQCLWEENRNSISIQLPPACLRCSLVERDCFAVYIYTALFVCLFACLLVCLFACFNQLCKSKYPFWHIFLDFLDTFWECLIVDCVTQDFV